MFDIASFARGVHLTKVGVNAKHIFKEYVWILGANFTYNTTMLYLESILKFKAGNWIRHGK